MILIERVLARIAEFIACDLFLFDATHVTRARGEMMPARIRQDRRQVVHRYRG